MKRHATAVWNGSGKEGSGYLTTQSSVLNKTEYSYKSRFEEGTGTNPEELLGAAHAGCFSMALAAGLSRQGFKVNSIDTKAPVHLEKGDAGFAISSIDLVTVGDVEGIDEAKFKEAAEGTKDGCIVSKALSAVPMTITA